jgi:hypothetical protein
MLLVSADCAVFLFCSSPSCLTYVARYSGLCFVLFCFSSSYEPYLPVSLDCVVFLFSFSPSVLPYVASFSGLCCVFVLFFSVFSTL